MTRHRVTAALMLGAALTTLAISSGPASASPSADWVSATSALVNKLGGVSLVGQQSCAGTFDQLVAGQFSYQAEDGQWATAPAPQEGEEVLIFTNPDDYTVDQPVGRKTMLRASHGSSIMSPCYATTNLLPDGTPVPERVACADGGSPCRWTTSAFGYDHDQYGPLFDYSSDGRFKSGSMHVRVKPCGIQVLVFDPQTGQEQWYGSEYGFDVLFDSTVIATAYR